MNKILVIPSIREASFQMFMESWGQAGDWDHVILVEDNPTPTFDIEGVEHLSWRDIDIELGEDASWIISKRDSAIRSFGFWKAYQRGADYILTLDDDCYPYNDSPIFNSHIQNMRNTPRWTESVPGMRTRGLPYINRGNLQGVVASMGLWSKIPDLDAVQSLNNNELARGGKFVPPLGSRIIPKDQYFPLCGMNFAFCRYVAPLCYFPLMGINSPYKRFDDIWFGIIFKKIIDHLGLYVSVGEPFVEHQRASDIMTNLVKEAPGIAANEQFWELIDTIQLNETNPTACMNELGKKLITTDNEYVRKIGEALKVWSSLF